MTDTTTLDPALAISPTREPRDWIKALEAYREPDYARSLREIAVTFGGLLLFWALAVAALSVSTVLTLALTVPAALFLLRMFMIQHDCGHGAFFRRKAANDWVGRAIGILTLTPYDVWKRSHAVHHSTTGNLDKRGTGDITTLTVREYAALSWPRRLQYRLYRHPLVMFGIGPGYLFLLQQRLPVGLMRAGWIYWASAMGTNLAIGLAVALAMALIGVSAFITVYLPTVLIAASIGVWLFYVQHQFEETVWEHDPSWQYHEAALYGSSYYDLPQPLRWFTANIGMHHVHHLYSRIPYYKLPAALRDHPELGTIRRLTIRDSLACVKLGLWCEHRGRLVSFAEAQEMPAAV